MPARNTAQHHHGSRWIDTAASLGKSVAVALPAFGLTYIIMQDRTHWSQPDMMLAGVVAMAVLNIVLVLALEPYQKHISVLTFPALMLCNGTVLLFIIAGAINRFFQSLGYDWLLPFVLVGMLCALCGVFREKQVGLKALLGINAIALAVLYTLGINNEISLPV